MRITFREEKPGIWVAGTGPSMEVIGLVMLGLAMLLGMLCLAAQFEPIQFTWSYERIVWTILYMTGFGVFFIRSNFKLTVNINDNTVECRLPLRMGKRMLLDEIELIEHHLTTPMTGRCVLVVKNKKIRTPSMSREISEELSIFLAKHIGQNSVVTYGPAQPRVF